MLSQVELGTVKSSSTVLNRLVWTLHFDSHGNILIYINYEPIKISDHTKCPGIHLDEKLIWKTHLLKKREELEIRFRPMCWLIRARNYLYLSNKRILCTLILHVIWTYDIQIWSYTSKTNFQIMQRWLNHVLKKMTGAPWNVRKDEFT